MANNYSQPFYGFPYAHPPPQAEEQSRPPHMQQPPTPDAFQSLPGLQPAALPGINFTSYGQNSQQPPFPPAAWPHQLPPDPKLWLPFFQHNGMIPPPPLPGLSFPPPSLPQTPQNLARPFAFPPQHPPQPTGPASERIQEVMDSEREDGELSEGEVALQPPSAKVNGRVHPEPPRSVPQPSQPSSRIEEAYNPDRPAAGQTASQEPARKVPQRDSLPSPADQMQKEREEAKQFVKLLNSHNIGYRTLQNEPLDTELLRGLYQSLNLPSEPAPILPPKSNGAASKVPSTSPAAQLVSSNKAQQQKSPLAVKTNINPAPSAKSAASPTAPGDRKDYIARLQAAKMAKQAGGTKPSPPQKTPPAKAITPAPSTLTPQPVSTPTAKPPVTDEQRARNTELIKQRLEVIKAMNAKQKPSTVSTNGAVAPTAPARQLEQNRAGAEQTMQSVPSGTSTPNIPSFPGIPGLFMNTPPSFAPPVSQPSPSIPQKRPAPADFTEVSTPRGSVTPYTRPLGQSPHTHQEESMIIQVTDDESNGSDMDIDDDLAAPQPSTTSQTSKQSPQQPPGHLPNFPSRSGSAKPASSAVSTPGPQTPSTQAREKALEDKEKQLAAMRVTLKKKLAEKREKDKAAAAAAVPTAPLATNPLTPVLPPQINTTLTLPTRMVNSVQFGQSQPNNASSTATVATVNPGRDIKRLRRAEIQSKLPSLDAEIANNTSRMAQLTKEMEQLMAQNEKIAKDKEQLSQELESLGIDTEGMSHAELRAKKDEIEHEKSPEPENTHGDTTVASQLSTSETSSAPLVASQDVATGLRGTEKDSVSAPVSVSTSSQAPEGYTGLPGLGKVAPQLPGTGMARPDAPTVGNTRIPNDTLIAPHERELPIVQDVSRSDDIRVEDPSIDTTAVSGTRGSATPLDDEEDFYSPPPPAEVDLNVGVNADEAPQVQTEADPRALQSPSEEGEVEMSESSEEEEEYEPEELNVITEAPAQDAQVPEPDTVRSIATSQVSTEDEEDYEPPDVDQTMSDVQNETANASTGIYGPHIEAEDGAMDIATSSSEESDDSDSDDETTPEPELDNSISANHLPQQDTNIADDLAPELQQESAPGASASETMPAVDDEDEPVRFTPYESPLRMFKSYRYHPSFAQDISGGFLSWTFSHQIDPEKPLCLNEATDGSCNDPECSNQHFRDIGITGEKLLVQLGTANPGKSAEEKQKWNDGLRNVLKELRTKNIKDPNGIAVEIAKYRRQFLNDDTRVVNL